MEKHKKILTIVIKLIIGISSFLIIYSRFKTEFTSENINLIKVSLFSVKGVVCFIFCLMLMPINWGIESLKWKLITEPIEKISYKTAVKSVYSGIFMGNLAPGRSTEFIAKIIFFDSKNRAKITVLHFINSLFQFSVTIIFGLFSLIFKINFFGEDYSWLPYLSISIGIILLFLLVLIVNNINLLLNFISKKIKKPNINYDLEYIFKKKTILLLIGFSFLRYCVFFTQLSLLIYLFVKNNFDFNIIIGIALYFFISSIIPMISFIEVAMRAAIAMVVFEGVEINTTISILILWAFNIVIPSIIGYLILLNQKFNFKLSRTEKNE